MTNRRRPASSRHRRRRGVLVAVALAAVAAVAPQAADAQGTIHADEFSGTTLDPAWTLSNPLGDASVTVGGGRAAVALPSGATHDVWNDNYSVSGLRTAAPNRDFEIEAKFDTAAATGFQQQGIIVEQDSNDLVRAEVHHDGGGSRLFVATIAGGSSEVRTYQTVPGGAPLYLRVVRTGSSWRIRYSNDGSSWITTDAFNFNLTVTKVGPLVGNSGSPAPAFTAQIDWFKEILPDTAAPTISGIGATPRTIDATIAWTTNESATSEVLYGPTTAYGSAKVASTGLVTSHSVKLHGLACGTTYHYQVRSKDAANNAAASGDRTLTTQACPATAQSDEFNGTTVDSNRWTLVDPAGDTIVGAASGQAQISLPAGSQHDVWTGADTVSRLLQPAPDDDFEMAVKYDSAVALTYQMQGLIVEQDANDLLRLEVHYEGSNTRLFAASLANGTASVLGDPINVTDGAPVYLRLRRNGSQWTFSYSPDGNNWTRSISFTRAMTVTAVGMLVGNSGMFAPAFEARADWFRYTPPDRVAPLIDAASVAAAPGAGSTTDVTWTTDEIASSEVQFGKTTSYGTTVTRAGDVANHSVRLHGLDCNTLYHYRVRSVDPSGNATVGVDKTFTSAACPALLQSDEFNSGTLDTTRWAFVDPLGDSAASVVTGAAQLAVPAGQAHDLWSTVRTVPRLLQAAPDDDFEVETKFATGVSGSTQQQGIVVEQSADKLLRLETFSEGSGTRMFVAAIDGGTADILYNEPVTGGAPMYMKVRRVGDRWTFGISNDGASWRSTVFDRAMTVNAVGPYVGNGGNTPPAFQGRIDYFREITDRTPPVVTQVNARPVSRAAQVTWTTDELASSVVEYRLGTGAWQTASGPEPLETRHSVRVPGLACATTYSFRVRSADALGNTVTSATASLTTAACTATGGPDIDVWNGDSQTFGVNGIPQTWVNVTGNVYDPDGVQSITGSINGGGRETLGIEPDGWRTARPGDFNYEINISELLPGANKVELRATDAGGRVTTRTVTVNWQGLGGGATPSATGPVLVIAAHPDDESLGQAGIIERAKTAGRRVYVAIYTNGEGSSVTPAAGDCGAPADAAPAARYGLLRDREVRDAMNVLGLTRTNNLNTTELIFLGYPGNRITDIAQSETTPIQNSSTGVQRTYAEDFDGNVVTCNGDFRFLLDGTHSPLSGQAMRADLDALLGVTQATDVYTHVPWDGHPDHAEIAKQVVGAVRRANRPMRVHETMQHPEGDTACMDLSSKRWPNPALTNNNPFARFTPTLDFTAPPAFPCDASSSQTNWGPMGAPNETVQVPANMRTTSEATNKKWLTIAEHESQIDCTNPQQYHANCGYMRAFVKNSEFFWKYDFGSKRIWPKTYSTNWTSNDSIAQQAQVLEGQWRYENGGVRPLTTGFDRAVLIGDTGWTDYDAKVPFTINSFDPTTGQGAAVGLALGWQGHNAWGQPRHGHPGGGLCLYARNGSDPQPFQLQIGYSPGPVDDTLLATKEKSLAPGVQYQMRFRQQDGFSAGHTRYSCKVWPASDAEPAAWDLQYDIPDWPGTTGQRSGSLVLLAHETDVTFGNATVSPLN